jgi:predicted transcriptional regulator
MSAGLRQIELAELSGIPQWKISDFETGKKEPSLEETKRLSDALKNRDS